MNTATRWYKLLYVQVLIGIVIGGLIGYLMPDIGARLQPLADGFIKLIKMLLAPIIFGTLVSLGHLMLALYVTTLFFIIVVLGSIARWSGVPLLTFLRYFKDEILVTLGTCSTEAVLPRMMIKLEKLGCKRAVVGMVLPTGYTFNSDGTCIYLTMAAIFVAQATNTPLTLADQLVVLGVLLLTSKGSAGVAGAGFVTLAATLSVIPDIPLVGLVLLLGVDRFLNEARAVTNLIGNGIGTIAIAKWDGAFDQAVAEREIKAMKHPQAVAAAAPVKSDIAH
ncbi:cation:dicarboxylate symporter family transporter [Pseudomonas sp. CDFA 610]|uniref:cation:dicarboxylate symporter family transporter n=1 Tax=Pseudomonas sp. CDFA 610 TaxID=2829825 RepID=UPI001E2A3808|nr:cation:dicarboxylase symporter family transporter [Pseudomonas sp. CDFA 610]MCD5984628.1 cation:dicarboxylase symporter family transporter [Pseudomonas sp. CDFA 610]